MFKYCLIQVLAWEVDKRKKKKILECKDCPFKSKCEKVESEDYYNGTRKKL